MELGQRSQNKIMLVLTWASNLIVKGGEDKAERGQDGDSVNKGYQN